MTGIDVNKITMQQLAEYLADIEESTLELQEGIADSYTITLKAEPNKIPSFGNIGLLSRWADAHDKGVYLYYDEMERAIVFNIK